MNLSKSLITTALQGVFFCFAMLIFQSDAFASHFRGGSATWTETAPRTIQFNIRTSWRMSAFFGSTPSIGTTFSNGDFWNYGDGTGVTLTFAVTSVNPAQDWIEGAVTLTRTYAVAGNYTAYFDGCCRISTLSNSPDDSYRVETLVNAGATPSNAPPSSSLPVIINMQTGLNPATFNIPAFDANGDPIRFRLATAAEWLGSSHPAGLSVHNTTGVLSFNTVGKAIGSLWTTAIAIEDLNAAGGVKSKLVLDFLIQITGVTSAPPVFTVPPTPANNSVVNLNHCSTTSFTVRATDPDPSTAPAGQVTLTATGVPSGATFNPTLPAGPGNPISSVFSWSPTVADIGSYVLTIIATDGSGSQTVHSITLNVQSCGLNITCPPALNLQCASAVPAPNPGSVSITGGGSSGITAVHVGDNITGLTCANKFVLTRTYGATNSSGAILATCTQVITVNDNTNPTVVCPANVTVNCMLGIPLPDVSWVAMMSSDNCPGTGPMGMIEVDFDNDQITPGNCPRTVTRTYVGTDACGNTGTCTHTITVVDNTPPQVICPPNMTLSCDNQVPAPDPDACQIIDACGGPVTTVLSASSISSFSCVNRYTLTRSYTSTDDCGNAATCNQTILVNDQTPPVLTCPSNLNVACASQLPAADINAVLAEADNCGGTVTVALVSDTRTNQTCANRFTQTRVYSATDVCGNSATCVHVVNVNDNQGPYIQCPANLSLMCSNEVPVPNIASVVATDNCTVTVTHAGDVTTNQTCLNRFTLTRTYSASDGCNASATCSQVIIVNDITRPMLTCPPSVKVNCAADVPAPNPGSVTTMDNCPGTVTVTHVSSVVRDQTCPNRFNVDRTYRASDACGNSSTCIQVIVVYDDRPPVFTNPPGNVTVECDAVPSPTPYPAATDNCAGTVTVTHNDVRTNGNCPYNYVITRTFTATDVCGNSTRHTQIITVRDTKGPVFTGIHDNIYWEECMATPAPDVTATDNCSGVVEYDFDEHTERDFTQGCMFEHRVFRTWTAEDECGNVTVEKRWVHVKDVVPPTLVGVPADATINCDEYNHDPEVTAYDNCFDPWISYCQKIDLDHSGSGVVHMTRMWIAHDTCGNTATGSQHLVIFDSEPPFFTMFPADITIKVGDPVPPKGMAVAEDWCQFGNELPIYYSETVTATEIIRSWTACDWAGNCFTRKQKITINPNKPVFITQPSVPATVNCANYPLNGGMTSVEAINPATNLNVPVTMTEEEIPNDCNDGFTVKCSWTATNPNGATATISASYEVVGCPLPTYCEQKGKMGNAHIRRVAISDLKMSSNGSAYSNFSHLKAAVNKGGSYTLNILPGFSQTPTPQYVHVLFDWNKDGAFDGQGEKLVFGPTQNGINATVKVPMAAQTGTVRMRVMINASDVVYDCSNLTAGEVEDYSLFVKGLSCMPANCDLEVVDGYPGVEYLYGVKMAGIQSNSGASDYSDFTAQKTDVERRKKYAINLNAAVTDGYHGYRNFVVYTDWNRDGDFDDKGEETLDKWTDATQLQGEISVPSYAFPGTVRMRVKVSRTFQADPCHLYDQGEVEDYTLYILPESSDNGKVGSRDDEFTGQTSELVEAQVIPNPASEVATLRYTMEKDADVTISVFDAAGKMVFQTSQFSTTGQHDLLLELDKYQTGMYKVTLTGENISKAMKMVVLK